MFILHLNFALAKDKIIEGKYTRKCVSYVNKLLLLPESGEENLSISGLDNKQRSYILNKINEIVKVERFKYIPITKSMSKKFNKKVNAESNITPEKLSQLCKNTVAKDIFKKLQKIKSVMAAKRITEVEWQKIIKQKWNTLSPNAKNLLSVLNSAYIYIPYLTSFSHKKEKGTWNCTIKGGIIWFQILTPEGKNFDVEVVVQKETKAYMTADERDKKGRIKKYKWFGDAKKRNKDDMKFSNKSFIQQLEQDMVELNAEEFSYKSAVRQWAKNILVLSKKIPVLRLQAMVQSSENSVPFDLGKKEGLLIDDKYLITEILEDKNTGKMIVKRYGWGYVNKVGDNSNQNSDHQIYDFSTLHKITGPRASNLEGMLILENPTQRIDFFVRPKMVGLELNDKPATAFAAEIGFHGYLSKRVSISQLFLTLGCTYGLIDNKEDIQDYYGNKVMFNYLAADMGIMKRFYLRRLALTVGANAGYLGVTDNTQGENALAAYKAAGDVGLEFSLLPNWLIGIDAGYSYALGEGITNGGFVYQGTGIFFGFHINYSPATLPFDPFFGLF